MKFNNTFKINDLLFFKYALLKNEGSNSPLDIKAEYEAFIAEFNKVLQTVSNYFGGNNQNNDNNKNKNKKKKNNNESNINTDTSVDIKKLTTDTADTIDIDELLHNINEIIGIDEFTGIEKQVQHIGNVSLCPTQNGTTDENDMEKDMLSFVDKLRSKTSKITILEKNHIKTEIELTNNELLILKLAVLHNNNTVNLMNRTEDIKNLMNKGLLHASENGCSLVVDKIVEVIIKTNTHKGNMVISDYDDGEEDSTIDANEIIEKELSSDEYNRNVQSFEWEIDCCMDKQIICDSSI